MPAHTTWDGQPISPEQPYGVTIVLYRHTAEGMKFLILHRAGQGEDGDWAWTPPSGARYPSEEVAACARRELFEETGLELVPTLTTCGTEDWWVFEAEVPHEAEVRLSVEHDRFVWMSSTHAIHKCQPSLVGEQIYQIDKRFTEKR